MSRKPYRSKKGKMPKHQRFIQIEHYVIRSDAWKSLSAQEVRVLLLLVERYNGFNNGHISLSIREAAKDGNMSRQTAQKALVRLTELELIKITFKGSFSQKVKDGDGTCYASKYAITFKSIGNNPPTKEFASLRPKQISRVQNSTT